MKMQHEKSCGAVVWRRGENEQVYILMIRHRHGGNRSFPKGHMERGETEYMTAVREVYEETGLTVSDLTLCGIKNWMDTDGLRYFVTCYKTSTFSGEIRSSDEGEVFWTPLDSLDKLNLCDNMQNMLKLFLDDHLTEHYFYIENGNWIEVLK